MLPKAPSTYMQERRGITAVATVAANIGQIWRETPTADVGVDGHLEFVNQDGEATGRTVAVQVKSGPSYLNIQDTRSYHFYPDSKHRVYWERYPIPVLLVLHDTESGRSYWTDIRHFLRSPDTSEQAYVKVPKGNILQAASAPELFESAGVMSGLFIQELNDVLIKMVKTKTTNQGFPLSFFDLFTQGLTNIARSVYFGMDLAISAAKANLVMRLIDGHLAFDHVEHQFLFEYIKFLLAQNLAELDFSDCLVDWVDREMLPHFVAPLTLRGRRFVRIVHEWEEKMVQEGTLPDQENLRVAQEGFFQMDPRSYIRRMPRISKFQEQIIATATDY